MRWLSVHGDVGAAVEAHVGVGEQAARVRGQRALGRPARALVAQPRAQLRDAHDLRDVVAVALACTRDTRKINVLHGYLRT